MLKRTYEKRMEARRLATEAKKARIAAEAAAVMAREAMLGG